MGRGRRSTSNAAIKRIVSDNTELKSNALLSRTLANEMAGDRRQTGCGRARLLARYYAST
jgi:hypothetical protein